MIYFIIGLINWNQVKVILITPMFVWLFRLLYIYNICIWLSTGSLTIGSRFYIWLWIMDVMIIDFGLGGLRNSEVERGIYEFSFSFHFPSRTKTPFMWNITLSWKPHTHFSFVKKPKERKKRESLRRGEEKKGGELYSNTSQAFHYES